MSHIHHQPWGLLNQFSNEINNLFDTDNQRTREHKKAQRDWTPAVDIIEQEQQFLIHVDIPGVEPKDIDIQMEDSVLTISGKRNSSHSEEKQGIHRTERVQGTFMRRFTLPDTANAEEISAKSTHGVLEISIPRQQKMQPKKINVQG